MTLKPRSNLSIALLLVLTLGGCADLFLDAARREGPLKEMDLSNFVQMQDLTKQSTNGCALCGAVELAFHQADAYAAAARNMQTTQDILSLGFLRAAGLVATGALDGVDDALLAQRAINAETVRQLGLRYTPRTAVQALYVGASRMNCIAIAGSLYEEVDLDDMSARNGTTDVPARLASFSMVLAMREVEYRALYGLSRNVGDFSTLLMALEAAAQNAVGTEIITEEEIVDGSDTGSEGFTRSNTNATRNAVRRTVERTILRQNPALERFFAVVSGCLGDSDITPDTQASASN